MGKDRIIHGGGDRYLVDFAHHLMDDGHHVTVFQPYYPIEDFKGPYPQTIVKHYEGIEICCIYMEQQWGSDRLNSAFNELTYDADLRVYFVTGLCWPEVKNPAISISHGIFWDFPQHPYARMTEETRRHYIECQMRGFTLPDCVVAVDHNVPNVIRAMEPGFENKIHVIPNYADTEIFKPASKTWEGIRVLFPRRSTLIRGWNLFANAARELPQYEFINCGDAANASRQSDLEASVTQVVPNLRQEHRHMNDMPSLYQSVDIVVIPTLGSEGSSLSEIEAMACGLPVIISGVGGTNEFIVDGYNGFKFDPNHHKLSEVIRYVAEDEELRKKIGQRARETAVECFSKQKWREKWRQIIPKAV